MKKLLVLAAVLLAIPSFLNAGTVVMDGDPAMYIYFLAAADVVKGEVYCDLIAPANLGSVSTDPTCMDDDTFCVHYWDDLGWATESADFPEGECFIMESGYYYGPGEACITVPCEGFDVGTINNFYAMAAFCDVYEVCAPEAGDCVDPNVLGSGPRYQICSIELTIVESPPALYVLQDTLYLVEVGLTAAYIPFGICNGDPCASPTDYNYHLWSAGHIGAAIDVSGTVLAVPGGKCLDVYGIIDAGGAEVCDYDTLTIIAWDIPGAVYDTCVQVIHVVEPVDVPLFSTPVVTILVLAMILAAAVIMKRTAASKA